MLVLIKNESQEFLLGESHFLNQDFYNLFLKENAFQKNYFKNKNFILINPLNHPCCFELFAKGACFINYIEKNFSYYAFEPELTKIGSSFLFNSLGLISFDNNPKKNLKNIINLIEKDLIIAPIEEKERFKLNAKKVLNNEAIDHLDFLSSKNPLSDWEFSPQALGWNIQYYALNQNQEMIDFLKKIYQAGFVLNHEEENKAFQLLKCYDKNFFQVKEDIFKPLKQLAQINIEKEKMFNQLKEIKNPKTKSKIKL